MQEEKTMMEAIVIIGELMAQIQVSYIKYQLQINNSIDHAVRSFDEFAPIAYRNAEKFMRKIKGE